ncbi:MAG TPA: hypothetical protein VGK17_08355 [Propionicimonas sp.]|jgi:hypothetical protein
MSSPGETDSTDLLVRARSALIDAIEALDDQLDAVIVIGAQAVYLRTGGIDVALAETTKDSDVALDPRALVDDPRVETAMKSAGFLPSANCQPGSWVTPSGIPVDLMVPEALAGDGGRTARGARLPPHDKRAMRRARGLEAVLVDNDEMEIRALDPADGRVVRVRVAGPAALLVAKIHKIWERVETPHRLNDKDAHDAYRLLRAFDTAALADVFLRLVNHDLCGEVTREAIDHLEELFGSPGALGAQMAGRAEEGVGDPEQVAVAVSILASDLLASVRGA